MNLTHHISHLTSHASRITYHASTFLLLGIIRVYRLLISPILSAISSPLGFGCRFTPTCSQYALEAIQKHGACRGSLLTAKRLCRCHPWGGSGYDPVQEANTANTGAKHVC